MNKVLLVLMLIGSANASNLTVTTQAKAYSSVGKAGNAVAVACDHRVIITNPTGIDEFPLINFKLCADNNPCQLVRYSQKVNNGTYNKSQQIVIYPTYRYAGHYRLSCITSVDGFSSQESVNDISIN